jgi:hypothetical protein
MKTTMNRIPFGNETKLYIMSTSCPGCGVGRGQFHLYGCPLESCPQCGKRLIKCSCMALSVVDEMKLTKKLSKALTRDQVLSMADHSRALDRTYEEKSGFSWICENASSILKKEMEEMALEIIGGTRHGDMIRVLLDKAAECLGLTVEDAAPIMDELQAECLYPGWDQWTGQKQ